VSFSDILARACFSLLCGAAGFAVFMAFLNRALMFIVDNRWKKHVIVAFFLLLSGGPALASFAVQFSPAWMAPVVVLAVAGAFEIHRAWIRYNHRAPKPVRLERPVRGRRNPFTTTDTAIAFYEVPGADWPEDRLRVVHVSDLHVSSNLPEGFYRHAVEKAAGTEPDIVVLTGDFVSRAPFIPMLPAILDPIRGLPSFSVLGNHDHWVGADLISSALREAGVTPLANNTAHLCVREWNLAVSGCEDPWGKERWQPSAMIPGTLRLALTHTADNIYKLSAAGMDAAFAGHYHAGQLRLPLFGPLVVPSVYGRRYDHGHFLVNGTHLFVSAGIGAVLPPFRLFCPPDVFVVDFYGASAPA